MASYATSTAQRMIDCLDLCMPRPSIVVPGCYRATFDLLLALGMVAKYGDGYAITDLGELVLRGA